MRVLVCGGRDYSAAGDFKKWMDALHKLHPFTTVIHGAATGADSLADRWARRNDIEIKAFPALWKKHGKSAGPIRNAQMLDEGKPDYVLAFPGGPGTANMIKQAKQRGIPVIMYPE
jgi:hypothetical protein